LVDSLNLEFHGSGASRWSKEKIAEKRRELAARRKALNMQVAGGRKTEE